MGAFLVYILKTSFCLAIFYLFYKVLLSRETFYRFNRLALLSLFCISALLPLIQINLERPTGVSQVIVSVEEAILTNVNDVRQESRPFNWAHTLSLAYFLGLLFFVGKYVYSIFRLNILLRKGKKLPTNSFGISDDKITIIAHKEKIAPFSWMHYIIISEQDLADNPREILIHECAHIHHHHSWDLLLADVCTLVQWFNPAAWLIKQELQVVHEYEADEEVLAQGVNARQYQLLLIKKAVGTRLYSMANSLNHSNLKKRITMMKKEKSNQWARAKYFYVLPLAAIAVVAFARPEVQSASNEISAVKVNDFVGNLSTNQEENLSLSVDNEQTPPQDIREIVDTPAVYPGGDQAMFAFIARSTRYPVSALNAGKSGRVVTSFVINEDGSVSDVVIVRRNGAQTNADLEAEAIRVVSLMKFTPAKHEGKVVKTRRSLPFTFALADKSGQIIATPELNESTDKDVMVVGYSKEK